MFRCNWEEKAENVVAMAAELNLGPESLLFVDDNPAELLRLQSQLPALPIRQTPDSGAGWLALLGELRDRCGAWSVSREDSGRTAGIQANQKRQQAVIAGGAGWLRELQLRLEIEAHAFPYPRSLELLNKTNQFNLAGVRTGESDWVRRARDLQAFCWSASPSDRFGDFGVIAVPLGRAREQVLGLENFVLSCRAFGRGVGYGLLSAFFERFQAEAITGPFQSTAKNDPARRFLEAAGAVWPAPQGQQLRRDPFLALAAAQLSGVELQTTTAAPLENIVRP